MSRQIALTDELLAYLHKVSLREAEAAAPAARGNRQAADGGMQISPDQGQFMALLVRLIGARRCLEIAPHRHSSLAVALALRRTDGGSCAQTSPRNTLRSPGGPGRAPASRRRIELHIAPARATLDRLREAGQRGSFDFAFMRRRQGELRRLLRGVARARPPGRPHRIDNGCGAAAVADSKRQDADQGAGVPSISSCTTTSAVDISMLPIGDGLTLAA